VKTSNYRGEDGTETFGEWFDTLSRERQERLHVELGDGRTFEEFRDGMARRPWRTR